MSTILITGGTGFVGGRLAKKLSSGHKVILSSRKLFDGQILQLHGAAQQVQHDQLLNAKEFPAGIETVIHLAALNEWDCVKYPSEAIRVNIDETRIILENSIQAGVSNFIYFSTAHIYGSPLQGLISENTIPRPVHPYAITHKAAEDYVYAAVSKKKIQGIIIRLSNSFGAPVLPTVNRWTLLANDLARQAIEKNKLSLLSNGCQYRDFVCLTDVENIINHMVSDPMLYNKTIYNLGSGIGIRVIDLASQIADAYRDIFGSVIPIETPAGSVTTIDPELHFSIERLLSEGVAVQNNIAEELKQLLLFCHKHFKKND